MKISSLIACLIITFAACKTVNPTSAPKAKIMSSSRLASFGSDGEFQDYMAGLGKDMIKKQKTHGTIAYSKASEPANDASNESITNNQELGVDEGGIVKNIGDHLVVLHKGRLSAVSIANNELKETDSLFAARSTDLQKNVWYDELLVSGSRIYVIGYRYHSDSNSAQTLDDPCKRLFHGATEVNSFVLKDGKLSRLQTRFIESADYFSGDNYASRMIDGRLVFYMPHPAFNFCNSNEQAVTQIPQELNYDARSGFTAIKPLFAGTDVYKNIDVIERTAMFHTVVSCGLPEDGSLDCKSKAVLGDYSRNKYVSRDFVYLATAKKIYSLGLKDLFVRAHASVGAPINQFSFKEDNGELNVIVEDYGADNQDTRSASSCSVKLLKLPLSRFDAAGTQDLSQSETTLVTASHCSVSQNRFVGRNAVIARFADSGDRHDLISINLDTGNKRTKNLAGYIGRIDMLSNEEAFLTVRSMDGNLEAMNLRLDAPEFKFSVLKLGRAAEGESRSHGFFQKPLDDNGHLVGLPILTLRADQTAWWGHGLSNVAFMRVAADDSMKLLGSVESGKDTSICQSSCVDWYGNTRPIFLKNRMFALMGHEMAEIKLEGDALTQAARVQMFGTIRQ